MALTQGKTAVVQAFVQTCSRTSAIAARALKYLSSSKVYKTIIFEKTIKINHVWFHFAANALSCLCLQSSPMFFFWKIGMRMRNTKKIGLFFHWLQIVLTIEKKRLYNLVFKIKVRSLINLMIILLGTNVSYWRNSHVFLDRSS